MNRKRFRYIDDEHDYTFLFDIRDSAIKVIITDNVTECNVSIADLTGCAKEFYQNKLLELKQSDPIERIKNTLYQKVV